jgi:hypothetical protein
MNILYIGPYRQIDYIGQVSLCHINSIKRSIKVTDKLITRPIYLDTSLAVVEPKYDTEVCGVSPLDVIIQYLPINFIAIQKNTKSIAIPIIDPKLNTISGDYEYKKLNWFNKVLVEDDKNKSLLKNAGLESSIDIYEEKIEDENGQRFNLETLTTAYKFGFIGQYQSNKQIIQKIIHAFCIASRYQQDNVLYLFLRGSDKDKEELDKILSEVKKQLKIPDYIHRIHIIFGMWDTKESVTALNSIDCFISLNDDYRYLLYEKFFISSNTHSNRFIINRQNTNTIETPIASLSNEYEYKNTLSVISTQDLINKILSAKSSQQKHKKTEYKSLGSILCKQPL